MRAHAYLGRAIDLHAGAGASALTSITDSGSSTTPLVYLNAGATLAIGRRLRLDAEVNPVFAALFEPDADPPVALLPVVRLRYVF